MSDVAINKENEVEQTSEDIINDSVDFEFPDSIKTVGDRSISISKKHRFPGGACVTYKAYGIPGSLLLNTQIKEIGLFIENMIDLIENDFLVDETGNENESIILPPDGVEFSDGVKGLIFNLNLEEMDRGLKFLFESKEDNEIKPVKVLESISRFLKALRHLYKKEMLAQLGDCHQLYFEPYYGIFNFLFDDIDIYKFDKNDIPQDMIEKFHKEISAVIFYLLMGAWPENYEYEFLKLEDDIKAKKISYDEKTNKLSGAESCERVWRTLPKILRDNLLKSCFTDVDNFINLDNWIEILEESKKDVVKCPFCEKDSFASAEKCIHCSQERLNENLYARWEIINKRYNTSLRIAVQTTTPITTGILNISRRNDRLMQLAYNKSKAVYGVMNVSDFNWSVTSGTNTKEIKPNTIFTIHNDTTIRFEGYDDVVMRFLNFEE